MLRVEERVDKFLMPFVSQLQLVLEVVEAVVDRCGGKHEDFGFHTCAYDFVHQAQVAVLTLVLVVLVRGYLASITEVVALINNHKVVVAPVHELQIDAVRHTFVAAQIGVEQHIIAKTVFSYGIILVVRAIGLPVVVQFLRTQHEDGFVSVLVILNNGKGGECFSKTYTIGKYAAVVAFQLIDDSECRVLLEII